MHNTVHTFHRCSAHKPLTGTKKNKKTLLPPPNHSRIKSKWSKKWAGKRGDAWQGVPLHDNVKEKVSEKAVLKEV